MASSRTWIICVRQPRNDSDISRPGDCSHCGKWIKCDMYRHVATYHLDLGQLWRCPVSWCTLWKGTPQDCMDHVRGAHDVPSDIKSASLERFFPSDIFGRMPSNPAIRGCPLTSCCSATLISRWCITTRSLCEGCCILYFGRTTSLVCGCSCYRQRPWRSVIWRPRFRPARFQHAMLAPVIVSDRTLI